MEERIREVGFGTWTQREDFDSVPLEPPRAHLESELAEARATLRRMAALIYTGSESTPRSENEKFVELLRARYEIWVCRECDRVADYLIPPGRVPQFWHGPHGAAICGACIVGGRT